MQFSQWKSGTISPLCQCLAPFRSSILIGWILVKWSEWFGLLYYQSQRLQLWMEYTLLFWWEDLIFQLSRLRDLVPWWLVWRRYGSPQPARESRATNPCCVKQTELWKTFEALDNVVIFRDKLSLSYIGTKKTPNYQRCFGGLVVKTLALRAHVCGFDSLQGQKEFFI